ncbi:MAG: DUF4082 domain-containing protein [Bacteroidota bacterium]|nr:DUF4082 domain-containing protein [Bacteroidota bacterium]
MAKKFLYSGQLKIALFVLILSAFFTSPFSPKTIFSSTSVPSIPLYDAGMPIEAGVKFRVTQAGYITGIRFYKGAGNRGTHIGHLWGKDGTKLAEATFTGETASGWQQVSFAAPVAVVAGTTYVASYFSSSGNIALSYHYFTSAVANGPIRALADGEEGGNGVYTTAAATPAFPTSTIPSANFWVDVVFRAGSDGSGDLTAPTIVSVSAVNGASNVNINTAPSANFNKAMNASTINNSTIELRNASNNAVIASTITYNTVIHTATVMPLTALANSTQYTIRVKGGSSGVKDVAGLAMIKDYDWTFTTADPPLLSPAEGPGGPILVISTSSNPFSRYTTEILRAEGLNEFAAADISAVTAAVLNNYDVVILGEMTMTAGQVALLTNWVNAGGTLIAFKPSSLLTPLLGIANTGDALNDKYLLVNTSTEAGAGIVNQTIQFHGSANLYTLKGATSIASLYSDANTATNFPAVTSRNVGTNGGRAVAFTYDLAKSIIYTRQGNPAWTGHKRDRQKDPIRPDDQFFPDWIDFNKIAIPQADEQQRLLANIILQSNLHRKPLPRFWYLPRDLKAVIVMTGDDHNNNGTEGRFNHYKTLGPNTAQDVTDWRAIRGTSYMYPGTPITNEQAMAFESEGFEIALHPTTGCVDYTATSLRNDFTIQLGQFTSRYPGLSHSVTSRTHCLAWSDWSSTPKIEWQKGIRLDLTYYYWPEAWMQNHPGMFTGSGMPMRYADTDGSLIDVYQAATQMTDETNMDYTSFCNSLLDKALGAEGYYGVFTANMHNDFNPSPGSDAIIAAAKARRVPVISAKQLLNWLEGRNNSSFGHIIWSNNHLSFTVTARTDAPNLKAMLPLYSQGGRLVSIQRDDNPVTFTTQTIKGLQYAFFAPVTGTNTYIAIYSNNDGTVTPRSKETTTGIVKTSAGAGSGKTLPVSKLFVNVMPNPGINYFNLVIKSNDANPVTVIVKDLFGRVMEKHERVSSAGILRVGETWTAGTYFAEIIQGDQKKVLKLIKAN